jgi:hypothetical protein
MSSTTLDIAFDADNEEGTPERELLPAGRYEAEVTTATVGLLKNGKGTAVNLTWTIIRGPHEKRLVFQNILLTHESPDAQRFGRGRFKDLCVACNVTGEVTDLGVLLYKPCLITVSVRKDKDGQYPDKNEVARIMPFVANWNGDLSKVVKLPPTSKPPTSNGGGTPPLNDKIPF